MSLFMGMSEKEQIHYFHLTQKGSNRKTQRNSVPPEQSQMVISDSDVWLISWITEWDCQLQDKDWYHRQEPVCEVTSNIYSWKVNQTTTKRQKGTTKR